MLIIPAIDLKSDQTVRLHQGDFQKISVYEKKPEDFARDYIRLGSRRLHIILLWGAKEGKISRKESQTISQILALRNRHGSSACKIQLGGGIRRHSQIQHFLEQGIDYLILGTSLIIPAALESGFGLGDIKRFYQKGGKVFQPEEVPEFELIDLLDGKTKEQIIVAVDFRNDEVGLSGWEVTLPLLPEYIIGKMVERGFRNFLLTNIERDGTLEGIDPEPIQRILKKVPARLEILISGGIRNEEDIEILQGLPRPPDGVVIGKALYQGKLTLKPLLDKFQEVKDAS